MIELLPEEIPPVTTPEEQRIVNAYHRLLHGKDWEIVRHDLIKKFRLNEAIFPKNVSGDYDPLRAALKAGAYTMMYHISTRLLQTAMGDANIKPELVIKK